MAIRFFQREAVELLLSDKRCELTENIIVSSVQGNGVAPVTCNDHRLAKFWGKAQVALRCSESDTQFLLWLQATYEKTAAVSKE